MAGVRARRVNKEPPQPARTQDVGPAQSRKQSSTSSTPRREREPKGKGKGTKRDNTSPAPTPQKVGRQAYDERFHQETRDGKKFCIPWNRGQNCPCDGTWASKKCPREHLCNFKGCNNRKNCKGAWVHLSQAIKNMSLG